MHLGGMQQSDSLHMVTDEKHMKIKYMSTSIQANADSLSITSPSQNQKTSGAAVSEVKRLSPGGVNGKAFTSRSQEEC